MNGRLIVYGVLCTRDELFQENDNVLRRLAGVTNSIIAIDRMLETFTGRANSLDIASVLSRQKYSSATCCPKDLGGAMQLYFFNVHDGGRRFEDQSGIHLTSLEDVPSETESLLRLLAYEHIGDAKPVRLKAVVRTADGQKVFRATIVAGDGCITFNGFFIR